MKFGRREHMQALLRHGSIYMNTVSCFRAIDDGEIRGDKNENLEASLQPARVRLSVDGQELKGLVGPMRIKGQRERAITHIFAACAIFEDDPIREDMKLFDERVRCFGDSAVLVTGLSTFMNRLEHCLKEEMAERAIHRCRTDRVEYVSRDKYHGAMGPFRKFDDYCWQKEWRLGISAAAGVDAPFQLSTGSIEDIARFVDVEHFPNRVEVDGDRTNIPL